MLSLLSILLMACRLTTPPPPPPTTPTPVIVPTTARETATPTLADAATDTPIAKASPTATSSPSVPPSTAPFPHVIAAITLGDAPRVCTGRALAVGPGSGHLYIAGTRDNQLIDGAQGEPCISVIDPTSGQVLETRDFPFAPQFLVQNESTIYAIGNEGEGSHAGSPTVLVADARTGEILARDPIGGDLYNGRIEIRDGWVYLGMPQTRELHLIALPGGDGRLLPLVGVLAFDIADDGRLAVIDGEEATTMRVYAPDGGDLLVEREIGPGEPGQTLAFAGQADRIFITRRLSTDTVSESRYMLDVLDAATLETVGSHEEWVHGLTADLDNSRVYALASEGRVLAFDAASGQMLSAVFTIPQGEPEGFTVYDPQDKLTIDPATGRIYYVYADFDGGTWAASFDPVSGAGVANVQVPPDAPWTLDGSRAQLAFAGQTFLMGLDAVALEPAWRMSLSRAPVSVAAAPSGTAGQGHLFIGDAGGDVHVLDAQTHAETQLLTGVGSYVDVDTSHGWLYAGDEFAGGISVYDLATLQPRGLIRQPGRPTASPADGRVYILEEDVYSADGATLEVIQGRTVRNSGCNGCSFPTGVVVDPTSGLTHTTTYGVWVGKPGATGHAAVDPLTGRAFLATTSGGYRVVYTLAAYADLTMDQLLAWRDGLYGQLLYNPTVDHLYLGDGPRLVVLDGETLDPVGWLYPGDREFTPAAVDSASGRTYLIAGSEVLVMNGTGGQQETPPPQPVTGLPGPVDGIAPLTSGVIFVRAYSRDDYTSRLYRSKDGGQTWVHIRGGLPGAPNDLVAAPGGVPDGALYAAAVPTAWQVEISEAAWGEGVYRSDDGGDTWTLLSRGLAHLRVYRLHVGQDGAVYARATGMWPDQQSWPVPAIWQLGTDGRWVQVEVPGAGPYADADGALPPAYTQAVDAFWHTLTSGGDLYRPWGGELQQSTDAGATWETVRTGPADYGTQVLLGTGFPPAFYWLTWDDVYRSTDGGITWARLSHPALAQSAPTAVVVTEWGGQETLFVGTEGGELLILPSGEATWVAD